MQLAQPLTRDQIQAAQALHARLTGWQEIETALETLADRFPGFDFPATLLKATAVNALYGTNVLAIYRMAKHVQGVLTKAGSGVEPWLLVERIAALPSPDDKPRRLCLSFASKFAHFFLDAEQYPIKDWYAESTLRFHLGRGNTVNDKEHPYRAYVTNHRRVKELSALDPTNRELDHYLWLAGQYRTWKKNPEARLSREIRELFEDPTPEVAADLNALLPATLDKALKGEL